VHSNLHVIICFALDVCRHFARDTVLSTSMM